jgi:hypothetical protein
VDFDGEEEAADSSIILFPSEAEAKVFEGVGVVEGVVLAVLASGTGGGGMSKSALDISLRQINTSHIVEHDDTHWCLLCILRYRSHTCGH